MFLLFILFKEHSLYLNQAITKWIIVKIPNPVEED